MRREFHLSLLQRRTLPHETTFNPSPSPPLLRGIRFFTLSNLTRWDEIRFAWKVVRPLAKGGRKSGEKVASRGSHGPVKQRRTGVEIALHEKLALFGRRENLGWILFHVENRKIYFSKEFLFHIIERRRHFSNIFVNNFLTNSDRRLKPVGDNSG